jgi:hypothetical protein
MKYLIVAVFAAVMVIATAADSRAGEYHTGGTLLCYDCHTMHYSMQHGFAGGSVGTTQSLNGDWLASGGPYNFLLKDAANKLCLGCHDGKSFAPDVMALNGGMTTGVRQAGALNEAASGAPYDAYKGHTLDSHDQPPGFDPAKVGAPATWYDPAKGLECVSCHAQHGPAGAYRNLGSYALGGAAANARPTYVIGAANDTTKDVWINVTKSWATDVAPATPDYYDQTKVSFNRNDATVGSLRTSNKLGTFCATCHANFHGGPGDTNIGGTAAALDGFIRHPASQVTIGAAGTQGFGGHSSLTRFAANTTKVKVAASDQSAFADATPICVTCHKAHGNQNPFGLIFLNRAAASVDEQGGLAAGQTASLGTNMRNLCGQCHGQGN